MGLIPEQRIDGIFQLFYASNGEISSIAPAATPKILAKWKVTMNDGGDFHQFYLDWSSKIYALGRVANVLDRSNIAFQESEDDISYSDIIADSTATLAFDPLADKEFSTDRGVGAAGVTNH